MKWTKTPPTKPGWYWAGHRVWCGIECEIVCVRYCRLTEKLLAGALYCDDTELSKWSVWSDQPIPQPGEAEGDYHVPFEEFMEAVRNAGEANPEIAWLANNEEAARSVHRGLEQSFKHKGKFIGRFAGEAEGVE